MRIKDLIAKIKDGQELTSEEQDFVDATDDAKEDEALSKAAEKVVAMLEEKGLIGKKEVIVDEKAITKEKVKAMTKEEKEESFFKALVRGDKESLKFLSTTPDSAGGYLVPEETSKEILNFLAEDGVFRGNATVVPNCPAHFSIDFLATLPTAYFRGEGTAKTASEPSFGQQALTPYSVSVLVPLTNELREDSMVDIASIVTDAMREALNQKEEEVFAAGDGNGKPTGLEHYFAAYPAIRKVTAAKYKNLGDRIVAADSRLKKAYRNNAKWYMPSDQLEDIRLLVDKNGRYLFQDDLTGEFVGRISGKPVEVNDNLTNIWFGDLKGYWIGQRGGIAVDESNDASITVGQTTLNLFQNNMFAIRVEERIDGELANDRALIAVEAGTGPTS
jgi:HK97 family phage major capsid protein